MSQELDRGKPLWEMWVVEGLEHDRFAIVTKAHHCMIDGVGSVELTGSVMRPTPDPDPALDEPPPRWLPRPFPRRPSCSRRAGAPVARALHAAGAAARALAHAAGLAGTAAGHRDGPRRALGAGIARVADAVQRRDRAAPPLRLDGRRSGSLKAPRPVRRHGERRRARGAGRGARALLLPRGASTRAARLSRHGAGQRARRHHPPRHGQPRRHDGRQLPLDERDPCGASSGRSPRHGGRSIAAGGGHAGAGGAERLDVHHGHVRVRAAHRRCRARTTWW